MNIGYGFIYETTNLVTGRKYIGRRTREFNEKDDTYLGSGKLLCADVELYGRENFKRVILKECYSKEELHDSEEYYLKLVDAKNNPGYYNLTNKSISWPVNKGDKLPDYWVAHMSESQRRRPPVSEETREKLRRANLGKCHTEETKKKLSEAFKGRVLSEEHRLHISESLKGDKHPQYGKNFTEEHKLNLSIAQKKRFSKESAHNKGVPMEEEQRLNLSNSMKELWKTGEYAKKMSDSHKGKCWMHKPDTKEKLYILVEDIDKYTELGWLRGRGVECKRIEVM